MVANNQSIDRSDVRPTTAPNNYEMNDHHRFRLHRSIDMFLLLYGWEEKKIIIVSLEAQRFQVEPCDMAGL